MQTIKTVLSIGALAGALTLCAARPAHAGDPCSEATLKGDFGFLIGGYNLVTAVQFAFMGRFSADGSGSFSGIGVSSRSGDIRRLTFTGTYNVTPGCTGSATLSFRPGSAINLSFVVVDDGREALVLVADTGTVEFGTIRRISTPPAAPSPAR